MAQNALLAKTGTDADRIVTGLSREMADIERVAALLRQQHPELQIWNAELDISPKRPPSPAWVAIGVVWAATLVLIGLVAAGAVFLLG